MESFSSLWVEEWRECGMRSHTRHEVSFVTSFPQPLAEESFNRRRRQPSHSPHFTSHAVPNIFVRKMSKSILTYISKPAHESSIGKAQYFWLLMWCCFWWLPQSLNTVASFSSTVGIIWGLVLARPRERTEIGHPHGYVARRENRLNPIKSSSGVEENQLPEVMWVCHGFHRA